MHKTCSSLLPNAFPSRVCLLPLMLAQTISFRGRVLYRSKAEKSNWADAVLISSLSQIFSGCLKGRRLIGCLKGRRQITGGGKYPETVSLVLWGTDNIKTYDESLAQVMGMIGVKLVADSFGKVNRVEPVSLEELGRPRVDVVVNCSGIFRDIFINQMNLLDKAVKMVAELDEPEYQNFVRKHALEQAKTLCVIVREAANRMFSNA